MKSDVIKIRPFARLLTMLGNQLIKNEQIAVIELIKNSYDADADWVKVSFVGFTNSFGITSASKIIIEDNGCGMTSKIIEKSWMNPATPKKFSKDGTERRTPKYNRVIQGEKGIGRYAMLKLGKTVNLVTRPAQDDAHEKEYTMCFDLSRYDNDFVDGAQEGEDGIYLDELGFTLYERTPEVIVPREVKIGNFIYQENQNAHGTRIEISNLSGQWNEAKLKPIRDSFLRFGDLFNGLDYTTETSENANFRIALCRDNIEIEKDSTQKDVTLANLLETQSVLQITNGHYSSSLGAFTYNQNGKQRTIYISDEVISGTSAYRNCFYNKDAKTYRRVSDFGDFDFDFYIFDLAAKDSSKYYLSREAKEMIKKHRIYLLRDDIRVLPYGDPDDDWLQIEVNRGTIRAGDFLSNDQVIGRIKISKFGNPHLKDKTNREGLIEEENYTTDFIAIIQSFLSYLRKGAYAAYLDDQRKKNQLDAVRLDVVGKEIDRFRSQLKDNKTALSLLSGLETAYKSEAKYLNSRIERTESLAAVGLSVETASHDIMMMLGRGLDELRTLFADSQMPNFDYKVLSKELQKLLGIFTYVQSQMNDMQLLFTSSKQRRRQIRVRDILDKVIAIYKRSLREKTVDCQIETVGSPLMAKCTDADLLQLLINLLDNAIYWLDEQDEKKIVITLDGTSGKMIFSDNGPGIREEDIPYIFEAFYSGKGEDGRGLGLYISRKLLERNDYSIDIADIQADHILKGANFVVNFIKQENHEY